MNTTIRLRIKKDIDTATEKKILKLKGSLIAQSFTDIIHYDDDGLDFYINYFSVNPNSKKEVIDYIEVYITDAGVMDIIALV